MLGERLSGVLLHCRSKFASSSRFILRGGSRFPQRAACAAGPCGISTVNLCLSITMRCLRGLAHNMLCRITRGALSIRSWATVPKALACRLRCRNRRQRRCPARLLYFGSCLETQLYQRQGLCRSFGDWDTDGVVPITDHASSPVSKAVHCLTTSTVAALLHM